MTTLDFCASQKNNTRIFRTCISRLEMWVDQGVRRKENPLTFHHNWQIDYPLTPNAQIWPRAVRKSSVVADICSFSRVFRPQLNLDLGGATDGIYLIIADLQSECGKGLDFINGMSFLERYYAMYDVGNSRIGLAKTHYTDIETN